MFKLLLLLVTFLFAQGVTTLTHVAYNGKVWAATGYRDYSGRRTAVICTSYDSISWTERGNEFTGSGAIFDDIAWLGGKFIAVGIGLCPDGNTCSLIRFSEGDTNFGFEFTGQAPRPTPCLQSAPAGDRLEKVRWRNGRYLALGYIISAYPQCNPYYGVHYYWSDIDNYLVWNRCTKADWDSAKTAVESPIVYDMSARFISASVYDIKGRLLKKVSAADFDRSGFASGVYILSLNIGVKIVNKVFIVCR